MSDLPTYVLERTFDAPRELVWRTWTDPQLVSRWYGPNVETIVHRLDLNPAACGWSKCAGTAGRATSGSSMSR